MNRVTLLPESEVAVDIEIASSKENPLALKQALSKVLDIQQVALNVRAAQPIFRMGDSAVLVATIGAVGGSLVALLTGLLALAKQSRGNSVKIVGSSGRTVELPADTPPEKINQYIDLAKDLDEVRRIEI